MTKQGIIRTLLLISLSLNGCALTGIEGPQRKLAAERALARLPQQLSDVVELAGNAAQGAYEGAQDYQCTYGSNFALQQQIERLSNDQQREFDNLRLNNNLERLRDGLPPSP